MKRKLSSEGQIIGLLKEAEASAMVTELCRKHGMSSATYYAGKTKFDGLSVSEARQLRALKDENAKLKRLLADATRTDQTRVGSDSCSPRLAKTARAC